MNCVLTRVGTFQMPHLAAVESSKRNDLGDIVNQIVSAKSHPRLCDEENEKEDLMRLSAPQHVEGCCMNK